MFYGWHNIKAHSAGWKIYFDTLPPVCEIPIHIPLGSSSSNISLNIRAQQNWGFFCCYYIQDVGKIEVFLLLLYPRCWENWGFFFAIISKMLSSGQNVHITIRLTDKLTCASSPCLVCESPKSSCGLVRPIVVAMPDNYSMHMIALQRHQLPNPTEYLYQQCSEQINRPCTVRTYCLHRLNNNRKRRHKNNNRNRSCRF